MSNYVEEFEKIKRQLHTRGYKEKDVTISSAKATAFGFLYALPFVIIFGLLYGVFLIKKTNLSQINWLSSYILLMAILIVSVVIHELLHGIGWAISSGKGWRVVRFNINPIAPSCACKVPLEKKPYLIGVLTPFVVLGLGSILFVFLYPGIVSFLTVTTNFVAAGADLVIAFNALKEKNNTLIVDHPTKAGYVAFYK